MLLAFAAEQREYALSFIWQKVDFLVFFLR
jgi:hypothetical protein